MSETGLSLEIARAIAKGRANDLKDLGLTKRNVNEKLCPGIVLKVRVQNKIPFISTISEPTPLIYAILCEQMDVVLMLITQFKASLDVSVSNWFPVHFAAVVSNYHILLNLVRIHNPAIEVNRGCDDLSTPLHIAVTAGLAVNALLLIKLGANPNAKNRDGNTPLHFCTKLGNLEIAKILLAGGAKVRIENANKQTPLYTSKLYNSSEMYSYLSGLIRKTIVRPTIKSLLKDDAYSDLSFLLLDAEEEEEEKEEEEEEKKKPQRKVSNKTKPPAPKKPETSSDDESDDLDEGMLEDIYNQLKSFEERINRLQEIEGDLEVDAAPATLSAITEKMGTLAAKMEQMEADTASVEGPHTCIV